MNIVLMTGRIVKDIETRMTTNGKKVLSNKIAVEDGYGEHKKTYFFNFVAWEHNANFLESYATKGDKICIHGVLTEREYLNKEGNKQFITEIIVSHVELMTKKHSDSKNQFTEIDDDELPF